MKPSQSLIACLTLSLLIASALAQDPNVKHYERTGCPLTIRRIGS